MEPRIRTMVTVLVSISLVSTAILLVEVKGVLAATDYTFGSENIVKGASADPANKDAEDAAYNTITELDQYTDTNYSGSSENVVLGTAGDGGFPDSLNTDDASRRSYTEENTGGAPPAGYMVYLYPDGDSSVNWDTVYPSDGVHYTKVDETTVDSDGATTYVMTSTGTDIDIFTMGDMSDPGAGYTLDVNVFACSMKDSNPGANFQAGIRISSTNYITIDINPTNGAYANNSGTIWMLNPATSAEWTYAEVNSLLTVITTNDASPNVYCSQVGLRIQVNFTAAANYELDAQITYSSVTDSAQTTGYTVLCQGYRTDASEDFYVQVYNYTAADWVTKDTIDQTSDTDFNFNLLGWAANCERSSGDEVKIRILGVTESSDTTQNIVYLDVLKVMEIKQGYAFNVELTCTNAPAYGNISLRVKGYVDAEMAQCDVYNYTAADWDTNKFQITDLGNAWQDTLDLCDDHHRDGTNVKIRFIDTTAEASDLVQDALYLDVVWVTLYYTDPEISDYTTGNIEIEYGQDVVVWCTYTDYDNQAPSYVRVHTNASYAAMDANDSDTDYFDGKLYGKTLSGLAVGWYYYWFAVDDAESDEVTTEVDTYTITVTAPSNTPANFITSGITQWQHGTEYQYNAQVEDDDSDPITWDLEGNGTAFLSTTPNGYFCLISGDVPSMGWWYVNISADDDGDTIDVTWQNYTLTALNQGPYFTFEAILTCYVNETYSCLITANDNNSDSLIYSINASDSDTKDWLTLNYSTLYLEGVPTVNGSFNVSLNVTDGLVTSWYNFTIEVDLNDADTVSVLALILALSFCTLLLAAGFKERTLWLLGGPCWMICGVLVFMDYGQAFMLMGVGLGMFLMIKGAFDVAG